MCLFITADLQLDVATTNAIAQAISTQCELDVFAGEGRFATVLHFSEEHSCACSLLDDSAHWKHECWLLHSEGCALLREALTWLMEHHAGAWTFEMLWNGARSTGELLISAPELLELVRHNQVRNTMTYHVVPSAPPLEH
ncbi:MAG: hypothetical protein H0T53_13145 [Herpetosiphonaceae bacterium]|nr:hypothetical protein [Herpetosiphonaceae bacterium]